MRFPALIAFLALSAPAFAQAPLSLADLGQDELLTAAFDKMAQGQQIPDWVRDGAVSSPAGQAGFGDQVYQVLTGCKAHECAANQIALLYQPGTGQMFGLLVTGDPAKQQQLTWLNIGGEAESIDGRTILYAATTGSLDNHPEAFDYREEKGSGISESELPAARPETVPATKPVPKPAE